MKTILIKNFKNLNNYGSGMMGLVTIKKIHKELNGNVKFYSDFDEYADIDAITKELDEDIKIDIYNKKGQTSSIKIWNSLLQIKNILSNKDAKNFDLVIILGGDDLSEYYGKHVWPLFLSYYSWSFKTKVVLLGQSIGPFKFWFNRFTFRNLARRSKIYTRDKFCFDYLKKDLGIEKNVSLSGDLAFLDLPLQHNISYEQSMLKKYGLETNKYITIVISGLVGKYYTSDINHYFESYRKMITQINAIPELSAIKICLLAHTYPPHGDEAKILNEFKKYLGGTISNLVFITDKVLQMGARNILGNGLLTITGRMHASVSTFQKGKPSISLAYSVKYKGVIGDNLGRNDLIVDANNSDLWATGEIAEIVSNKVSYILNNYDILTNSIREKVAEQKILVNDSFEDVLKEIR